MGKLWSAGTLSITYPHGSARIGSQDASIKSTGYFKIRFVADKKLFACLFVVCPKNQVNTHPSSQSIGSRNAPMRTSHPSGSRHLSLPKGKDFSAPGSFEPQKIIGTKPCPMALTTTGLMVLRRNGPDPEWFKAWAYQLFIIVTTRCFVG